MNVISEDIKIKKIYPWKESGLDYIQFPHGLYVDFLHQDGNFFDIPINVLRVIFNIIRLVRNDQFLYEKYPRQLSLFEDDFETENNVFVQLSIKNNKITTSRSCHQVIKAYEFLTKFKMEWHKALNSKGEEIRTFGGLISNPTYNQRGQTTFLISRYWLRKIIVMPHFNYVLYELVYNIRSNKHILFALWLETIENKDFKGCTLRLSTFNKKFGVNYSKAGDFCTKFLFEIRKNLDKFSTKSFTYKYNGNYITIIPNNVDKIKKQSTLESKTILVRTEQRISYLKKRFNIQTENYQNFITVYYQTSQDRELIEKSYKEFKTNCRKRKLKSNMFTNKNFLEEIQRILIEKYLETETGKRFPNGFPVIT